MAIDARTGRTERVQVMVLDEALRAVWATTWNETIVVQGTEKDLSSTPGLGNSTTSAGRNARRSPLGGTLVMVTMAAAVWL